MTYRIEIADRARSDAQAAFEHIRQEAPTHAAKWYQGLEAAIRSLAEMPTRCPLAPEAKKLRREMRQLLYGKRTGVYRIIFRVEEKAEDSPLVRILHIRHGSRDRLRIEDLESEKSPQ